MRSAAQHVALLRFSTGDFRERERLPLWREFFTRNIVLADIKPLSDLPMQAEATLFALPRLLGMWNTASTPAHYLRTPQMVAEGDDSFAFIVKQGGHFAMSQRGAEVSLGAGDAVGVLHAEPAAMTISQVGYFALVVPRSALTPFVGDVERAAMRLVPQDTEALRLLVKYVGILQESPALVAPELRHLTITHVHDLIAVALGATRDGAAIAKGRGVRAARLRATKADILENLGNLELTVRVVALRQRVTPRYIHKLFETEGMTFSEFVLGERLMRAHRMLCYPRLAGLSITNIAFAAGFGDLSYFNRTFRRRFGATPSELRRGHRDD